MKAVFISDAHINDHTDPNLPALLGFLDHIKGRVDRLYVVGDLFDTWFGFPRAVFDEYVPLLGALHAVKRSGVRIVYVTGNHDFEMGHFFENILDADIHDTSAVLEEDGLRVFVAHGDMANPHDGKYRFLRKVLRARFTRWLGRRLPPSWVWRIGRMLTTRCTGEEVARRMPLQKIFNTYAAEKLRDRFDAVVLGHLHIPTFDESSDGGRQQIYINLGDWINWRTFMVWEDGRLDLKQWAWPEAEERRFTPPSEAGRGIAP